MKQPLLRRFQISCVVILILTGLTVAFSINMIVRRNILNREKHQAMLIIQSIIRPKLSGVNFSKPIDGVYSKELLDSAEIIKEHYHLINMKIWNPQYIVIFSTDKPAQGKYFIPKESLQKALNGIPVVEISSITQSENKNLDQKASKVIQIFSPIKLGKQTMIDGVLEIKLDYKPIQQYEMLINQLVWITTFVGFVLLYILLYGSIKRTSTEIIKKNQELEDANINIILTLAKAVDARDSYTMGHSERVMRYAVKLGERLNLPYDTIKRIEESALLHDIGKIAIPDAILNKPGKLTEEEYNIIKSHPVKGYNILKPIIHLEEIRKIIRHHHERIDGYGYPDGLAGAEIPMESRILAVADAFDAMTSDRAYRKALTVDKALEELKRVKGSQLDEYIVEEFIDVVHENQLVGL